jgi:hypothetical protein
MILAREKCCFKDKNRENYIETIGDSAIRNCPHQMGTATLTSTCRLAVPIARPGLLPSRLAGRDQEGDDEDER